MDGTIGLLFLRTVGGKVLNVVGGIGVVVLMVVGIATDEGSLVTLSLQTGTCPSQ